jgi:signal transduction histidine kinase
MLELSNELNARLDLYEIADIALFNLMGHFGSSRAALWTFPERKSSGREGSRWSDDVVLLRSYGLGEKVAKAMGAVWAKWLLGRPGGEHEPILVSDLRDLTVPGLSLAEEHSLAVVAPIVVHRKWIGLMALGKRVSGSPFSRRDLEVLSGSLNFVGISLENSTVYNRMLESNRSLREANERLLELDELKSEFLRNLNHELRTPLTVISAYADSLLLTESEDGPRAAQLRTLCSEAHKLEGLVLNLLDFGKMIENTLELELQRGDVVNALGEWCAERRPGVTAEFRELRFSHAADVPPAVHELRRTLQVVDCLVGNAVKFCPAGTRIRVRVEPEKRDDRTWVRIDVEDNGPGIPEDRVSQIWDAFRQGDGSETREHGGLGFGLAFARELAGKMNGRLEVRSELGRGSTFSLYLPAA